MAKIVKMAKKAIPKDQSKAETLDEWMKLAGIFDEKTIVEFLIYAYKKLVK